MAPGDREADRMEKNNEIKCISANFCEFFCSIIQKELNVWYKEGQTKLDG